MTSHLLSRAAAVFEMFDVISRTGRQERERFLRDRRRRPDGRSADRSVLVATGHLAVQRRSGATCGTSTATLWTLDTSARCWLCRDNVDTYTDFQPCHRQLKFDSCQHSPCSVCTKRLTYKQRFHYRYATSFLLYLYIFGFVVTLCVNKDVNIKSVVLPLRIWKSGGIAPDSPPQI